ACCTSASNSSLANAVHQFAGSSAAALSAEAQPDGTVTSGTCTPAFNVQLAKHTHTSATTPMRMSYHFSVTGQGLHRIQARGLEGRRKTEQQTGTGRAGKGKEHGPG